MMLMPPAPMAASSPALSVPGSAVCRAVTPHVLTMPHSEQTPRFRQTPRFQPTQWQQSVVTTGLTGAARAADRGYAVRDDQGANAIRVRDLVRATKPAAPPRGELR